MKQLMVALCAALGLAGCATYQGGTGDEYTTTRATGMSSGPVASPTFRPGMNPKDIRDPNALTTPSPHSTYPPQNF